MEGVAFGEVLRHELQEFSTDVRRHGQIERRVEPDDVSFAPRPGSHWCSQMFLEGQLMLVAAVVERCLVDLFGGVEFYSRARYVRDSSVD